MASTTTKTAASPKGSEVADFVALIKRVGLDSFIRATVKFGLTVQETRELARLFKALK